MKNEGDVRTHAACFLTTSFFLLEPHLGPGGSREENSSLNERQRRIPTPGK